MNPNTFSIIALLASVFFAGAYLRGEISRKQELKNELKAIQEQQERTMAKVDSVNAQYLRDKMALLLSTQQLYGQIETVLQAKGTNTKQLQKVGKEIHDAKTELAIQTELLKAEARRQRIILLPPEGQ